MQKIVINGRYGGFGNVSDTFAKRAIELGWKVSIGYDEEGEYLTPDAELIKHEDDTQHVINGIVERDNAILVQLVEELGAAASGSYAAMHVVEIPDDVEWQICEYDGLEWVAEKHRTWR